MCYTIGSISDGFLKELERLFDDLEKKKIDLTYKNLSEFARTHYEESKKSEGAISQIEIAIWN